MNQGQVRATISCRKTDGGDERAQAVDEGERFGQFAVGHERIERDIGFDTVYAAERKRLRQLVRSEISGLGTCVEALRAEINRVRAGVDGAAQRLGTARRRKQLGHPLSLL